MIVTIDGPAGAGKSSIARQVAERLGFEFLDTGAMYRCHARRHPAHIKMQDADALAQFVAGVQLRWENQKIYLNNQDVSHDIPTPTVTRSIRHLADIPRVREELSRQQRTIAAGRNIVTEGRDQGTEVFPDAECKVYLTASPEERARRRQQQLAESGRQLTIDEILVAQNQRDLEDRMREVGRLRAAPDAVVLQSDGLTPDEVLNRVLQIVEACIEKQNAETS